MRPRSSPRAGVVGVVALGLRDRRGVAALEFAVTAPFFLLLCLGGFDAMKLIRAYDKTQVAAMSLAGLTAQETTVQPIAQSEVAMLLSASAAIATPYNGGGFAITVSAIDLTPIGNSPNQTCCNASVRWSATQGGTQRPCRTPLRQIADSDAWAIDTIPKKLATQTVYQAPNASVYVSSIVVVDVSYNNTAIVPLYSTFANRTVTQHDYAVPRMIGQVAVAPAGGSSPVAMTGLSAGQSGTICS